MTGTETSLRTVNYKSDGNDYAVCMLAAKSILVTMNGFSGGHLYLTTLIVVL